MATVSFSYYTAYINAVDTQNVMARDSTFVWIPPTFTTYFGSYTGSRQLTGNITMKIPTPIGGTNTTYLYANSSAVTSANAWSGAVSFTLGSKSFTTSSFFNSNNPTTRTLNARIIVGDNSDLVLTQSGTGTQYSAYTTSDQTLTNVNITLDVPPTADISSISYDTGYVYATLTTASVTVSNSTAYYGGTISSVEFAIGSQTATLSGDGTLSIALNAGGTFTPTVTVTDSRGQTYTETFSPITVNTYTAPTVSFDVDRTDANGDPDDEGTYCLIEATLTFADVIATAVAPSVVITDENGTQTTPTVTWYTDDTLTTTVTWANVSSGDTVYGIFPGVNTQYSYSVSVRPRDSEGTGTAITQTLGSAFYTVDFYAGGHGVAFGKPASADGFDCAMTTMFRDDATFGDDVFIDLPNYQIVGNVDKAIYDAIIAIGWDNDVLET